MEDSKNYGTMKLGNSSAKAIPRPSALAVHAALIATFAVFGGGAFASKFGIYAGSPMLFELVREAVAGPMMCLAAKWFGGPWLPQRDHAFLLLLTCLMFVCNQVFFFAGLKLTEPIFASAWQVAIPIFTTLVAVLLGYEQATKTKTMGIIIACSGAVLMNMLQARSSAAGSHPHMFAGHACFLLQSMATSGYIILSKPLLEKYPPLSVTGWCFTLGSVFMLMLTAAGNGSETVLNLMCSGASIRATEMCLNLSWSIPPSMIIPLFYEIVGCSFVGWFLLTWANRFADASTVATYSVTQPFAASILSGISILLFGFRWAQAYGIEMPGIHHLVGVLVISLGLYVKTWRYEEAPVSESSPA